MSALQWCWVAVTVTTIIFLIVAAISALPKMKAAYTACIAVIFLAASGITAFGSSPGPAGRSRAARCAGAGRTAAGDARAGKVVLTFDDGPDFYTAQVIAELNELHLHGVFFDIGWKAAAQPGAGPRRDR